MKNKSQPLCPGQKLIFKNRIYVTKRVRIGSNSDDNNEGLRKLINPEQSLSAVKGEKTGKHSDQRSDPFFRAVPIYRDDLRQRLFFFGSFLLETQKK